MSSTFHFTEQDFSLSIHRLGQAFSECLVTQTEGCDPKTRFGNRYFHTWRVERPTNSQSKLEPAASDVYLIHDTVATLDSTYFDSDDEHLLEDDAISYYEESAYNTQMDDICVKMLPFHNQQTRIIEFSLSVCFSHVWCVPVLYFRAQDIHGQMISRASLLRFIQRERNITATSEVENVNFEENFISEEEHPVTRVPCFFLHPCCTSQLLHTMSLSIEEGLDSVQFGALLILSWLGMVVTAIQFRISPLLFIKLVNRIKARDRI